MKIEFYKYQGTGNDFVILDNRRNQYNLSKEQVKFICEDAFGIGADGLMMLNQLEGYDFEMKYYNSDGAESTMCGNGGRCLVKFAYDMGINKPSYNFLAVDGPHDAVFGDHGWVRLKMKDVNEMHEEDGNCIVDTGSPHYVKMVDNVRHYEVVKEGKRIRYSKKFKEHGINVNFVEVEHGGISVRTYERGVEDETLSCGTGVTASALVSAHNHRGFNRVEVSTLGGRLAVEFDKIGDNQFSDIWLCGPAAYVFKGEIEVK
jgi:diaminopimelate epimerase